MSIFKKKSLSARLKEEAISLGLCTQWQREWNEHSSDSELLEKYIRGIDFCIAHDWPSPKFIRKHFDKAFLHQWGLFVDETVALSRRSTLVFLGSCSGCLAVDGIELKNVYIRHRGNVSIEAKGHARVYVSIYDDVKLSCVCDDGAKIFVYQYGGSVEASGNVVVRERRHPRR